jgi:hypothetical protein
MSLQLHSIYPFFAIFDDRLRSSCKQAHEGRYKLVGICGKIGNLKVDNSIESVPRRVHTAEESSREIYVWRTPYSVRCDDKWVPVVDFSVDDCYEGPFPHTVENDVYEYTYHRMKQQTLRLEMIDTIRKQEVTPRSAVPKFIAELVQKEAIAKKESCPITMIPFEDCDSTTLTSCYHLYETAGINKWLENNMKCPICKQIISSTSVI